MNRLKLFRSNEYPCKRFYNCCRFNTCHKTGVKAYEVKGLVPVCALILQGSLQFFEGQSVIVKHFIGTISIYRSGTMIPEDKTILVRWIGPFGKVDKSSQSVGLTHIGHGYLLKKPHLVFGNQPTLIFLITDLGQSVDIRMP